ncbi:MAG: NADH-quinone oxidoreductase subunit L [Planctomycetia bacterium]|nr:NADH-quinone oxidoreductase subunit L [Planctomycetia bacterium]
MPPNPTQLGQTLGTLLTLAWLLPLFGFAVEIFGGFWGTRKSKAAAYLAVACIGGAFVLSLSALLIWGSETKWAAIKTGGHGGGHAEASADPAHHAAAATEHAEPATHAPETAAAHAFPKSFSGTIYVLAEFRTLRFAIDYYIDSLTLVMFTMVTLIASLIHLFAIGYMGDELTDDHEDHQVHTSHGHLHRPGRFYRFFAFLSLFSFSMLGLVLAGNVFMVFIFWELVGVCSYFLIGFYTERKSASTAANKAFIMNRVGDFGFLIGLMILLTYFGTFQFATRVEDGKTRAGLFDLLRDEHGAIKVSEQGSTVFLNAQDEPDPAAADATPTTKTIPYYLLLTAGLGVFAGCIGKSAQFPLQTWLPDAMEGPTPVSALVHSATMVAAGVYLTGRFYPMFVPEVLLTIAYIGCITLFLAATIAIVATDIKRVLAYSTISQLGYMMLGLGVGGWVAGLFHLITHAFFKSLMFLASGSVIYGCHHVQEMPQMGGLWKKMPITAFTMLVGVIAIAGLAVPGVIAFSGYHSKDAIVATALTFAQLNSTHFLLFYVPLVGAGITAFYMFRLWFYTFAGEPRDHHVYEHAHESPWVMTVPLIVLSVFAAFCASGFFYDLPGPLEKLLLASEPAGVAAGLSGDVSGLALPSHAAIHANHKMAGTYALLIAALGTVTAYLFYGARVFDPAEVKRQLSSLHTFLAEKWWFDEVYDVMFVRPAHIVARGCAAFDRVVFDGFLHFMARLGVLVSKWDRVFDEQIIDGFVNRLADVTFDTGRIFGFLQTGRLRQYVMFIAVGVVGIFILVVFFG